MSQNQMICPLTGVQVDYSRDSNHFSYDLEFFGNRVEIFLCDHCCREISLKDKNYIIKGLIANNKWPKRSFVKLNSCEAKHTITDAEDIVLPGILNTTDYPKTPKEKMDNFFLFLFNKQTEDGQSIYVDYRNEDIWVKNYFKSSKECEFYLKGLQEKGLINVGSGYIFQITHLGLNKALELQDDGKNSNNCFIAMAFNDDTIPYRIAIKEALDNTGFKAIIIDEENIDSDKTIPDAIFAGIKKSKFCIADFSFHNNGVYFESGFALGLGIPVIYTCNTSHSKDAHFDIKQLQQIRYSSPDELTKMLTDKIEAWIK